MRKKGNANCANRGSLESTLIWFYERVLLENVNEKQDYSCTLEDLRSVIVQMKNKFALLLSADDLVKNSYKIMERQTPYTESDLLC